jgi:hypothetical protein
MAVSMGDPKLQKLRWPIKGFHSRFESNAGQSVKPRGSATQEMQKTVDQGDGCFPPNMIPRASGPSAVTVATTIATMAAVMASANP